MNNHTEVNKHDEPHAAFKFKTPSDGKNRRLVWGFKLEALASWYIRDAEGKIIKGFREFIPLPDGTYRQFLTPGLLDASKTYIIYFRLKHPRQPSVTLSMNMYLDEQLVAGDFATAKPMEGASFVKGSAGPMLPTETVEAMQSSWLLEGGPRAELNSENWTKLDLAKRSFARGGKTYAAIQLFSRAEHKSVDANQLSFLHVLVHASGLRRAGVCIADELLLYKDAVNRERAYSVAFAPASKNQTVKVSGLVYVGPIEGRNQPDTHLWIELDDEVEPVIHVKSQRVILSWDTLLGQ